MVIFFIWGKIMDKKDLEYFRGLLNHQLAELLDHGQETVSDMIEEKVVFADPTDRAGFESDRNFTLRIRDRERKLITKIQDTLLKIEDGTFGICEECEEDIPIKRLTARPVTSLCVECKSKAEALEKKKKG